MKKLITINNETREVEMFDAWNDGRRFISNHPVGLFRKGSGKLWAERVNLWQQKDGAYKLDRTATILNRGGYVLVGWADQKETSEHNSAKKS